MYITNSVQIAEIAQRNGVDWIFIDLELLGKEERQGHLDTVISRHSIDDVKKIKNILNKSKLLVRIDPMNENTKKQIDQVVSNGADIVMLPYFKSSKEVQKFIDYVDRRVETCLLLETPEAVEDVDNILSIEGIDYIHIGLNDLHLGYKLNFMFELLINGVVDELCDKFRKKEMEFGFGGVSKLGEGALPAEMILTEHFRQGSNMVILSRSFCDSNKIKDKKKIEMIFDEHIGKIRKFNEKLMSYSENDFIENRIDIAKRIDYVLGEKNGN